MGHHNTEGTTISLSSRDIFDCTWNITHTRNFSECLENKIVCYSVSKLNEHEEKQSRRVLIIHTERHPILECDEEYFVNFDVSRVFE